MASETAVLATDVGGVPEQVVDGETGRLVPPGDVEALGDALAALTGDPDRLRAMGEAGRARLEARNWTWEGHARRVRELHREVIR
jgi:glycosyltransferase involved in cell wall biosynthesis